MIINNDQQQVADTVVLEGTQNIWKEFSEELSNIFRGPEVLFLYDRRENFKKSLTWYISGVYDA